MSNQNASFDDNGNASLLVASSTVAGETVAVKGDPTTGGLVSVAKAQYNATPPTPADTDLVTLQSDSAGNMKTYLATQLDPINDIITTYPFGHSYTYISTATTTVVKSGAGTLIGIIVNGGTTGTITVYDNTAASGTTPFVFDTTNAIAPYRFDIGFSTGCTIVTSAATKITAIWR